MRLSLPLPFLLSLLLLVFSVHHQVESAETWQIQEGDHLCLVGNALGERLQHHNEWESQLHLRFPSHELVVRNLCFPGDEPFERIRSENFGEPDQHLRHSAASAILYFFGFNESFDGAAGVADFTEDLTRLVNETKAKDYGRGAPRIALVTPIAFEDTGDPKLPDADARNENIKLYRDAIIQVAADTGVVVADVYSPTLELFADTPERLTLNGCHLNEVGYAAFAKILNDALFGPASVTPVSAELKAAVDDKNFHWWHRYRAVNGFSIYGGRGKAGTDGSGTYNNTDVMERERAILDQMTANRDQRVWALASGQSVDDSIDDSNTLPFLNPTTNVGGANDENAKRGKLGSLEYLTALEQQELFDVHEDFEIQLVASEEEFPELANPVALNFDNQGRLMVATMPSYPHWKPKTKLDDKILILKDVDQDGKTDEVKVFAGELHQPTGFEVTADGVWVAEQPDILLLTDTDGDDVADVRTRKLFGFDTADSHHGISAFEWGPGGNLYFQEGTFKFSQVETPYGLRRLSEAGVWRYHPKNENLDVFSNFAFANPWGHVFDRWGQNFIGDASPGRSYFAAPISGRIDHPLKHPGGSQHRRIASIAGGDPSYQFPTFYPMRIRPLSGCAMISSRHFPDDMQGNFLVTNVIGDRGVLNHEVREDGSSFQGKEVAPLLLCRDGNFRPVDVQIAPDGSLYIVDWHNALIGHLQHNLRDPSRDHSHGRIWRIKHKTRPLLDPPRIAGQPIFDLLDLLKSPEDRTRYRARRELASRDSNEVAAAIKTWVDDLPSDDPEYQHHLMEGLWMLQTHHVIDESMLDRMLQSPDHRARAAATRVLSFWLDDVVDPLSKLELCIHDEHPRVRLEAVRALSYMQGDEVIRLALAVLDHDMDKFLQYTLDEAMRRYEQISPDGLRLYSDVSLEAVAYQVNRLSDHALLASKRDSSDPNSIPLYTEILKRSAITPQQREEAVMSLAKLTGSSPVSVLLDAIGRLDSKSAAEMAAANKLASRLFEVEPRELKSQLGEIKSRVQSTSGIQRSAAIAACILAGDESKVFDLASKNKAATIDYFVSISMLPKVEQRNALRHRVAPVIASQSPPSVRRAALKAIGSISENSQESFSLVAPLVGDPGFHNIAIDTLLKLPRGSADEATGKALLEELVVGAEKTPPAKRTTREFTAAMQLADRLMGAVPADLAKSARERLREITVRLIRIKTVEEEMRYDLEYFAVQAGRPVQIVLENHDLMPHNLVITQPGALKEVAGLGLQAGPNGGWKNLPYVPKSDLVIQATGMVDANRETRLTFKAPDTPGEYPYVCTFPQHWYRMYGVMVVVDDLDAFLRDPVKPANPIGSNRTFIANWSMSDFDNIEEGLKGRSAEIGSRIFVEASCAGCHKAEGVGGVVGPDLTDLYARVKGDHAAVLRSILDPSHTVDEKYAMRKILTFDGKSLAGVVVAEDDDTVELIMGAEASAPTVIAKDDIDVMQVSTISMMPKALMDQFTKDEVFELMSYLKHINDTNASAK
ncbi:Auracyanin-A precursor [Rubripirellula amarantea]|uniref:Auracyanin-A n=1 Tax=Rubripirellula amarantea TaxID=2527999 RepID=A0A5C5WPP9_9BACT|nr:PVC-type heme-binding CxxCH protein [Rubripirellula amarantea]TWT52726.1 Auracyanin-A precursor [Rubripirellula amarantea]